jgi:hypothetical protein
LKCITKHCFVPKPRHSVKSYLLSIFILLKKKFHNIYRLGSEDRDSQQQKKFLDAIGEYYALHGDIETLEMADQFTKELPNLIRHWRTKFNEDSIQKILKDLGTNDELKQLLEDLKTDSNFQEHLEDLRTIAELQNLNCNEVDTLVGGLTTDSKLQTLLKDLRFYQKLHKLVEGLIIDDKLQKLPTYLTTNDKLHKFLDNLKTEDKLLNLLEDTRNNGKLLKYLQDFFDDVAPQKYEEDRKKCGKIQTIMDDIRNCGKLQKLLKCVGNDKRLQQFLGDVITDGELQKILEDDITDDRLRKRLEDRAQILRNNNYKNDMKNFFEGKTFNVNHHTELLNQIRDEIPDQLRNGKTITEIEKLIQCRILELQKHLKSIPKLQRKKYFRDHFFPTVDKTGPHWSDILRVTEYEHCTYR